MSATSPAGTAAKGGAGWVIQPPVGRGWPRFSRLAGGVALLTACAVLALGIAWLLHNGLPSAPAPASDEVLGRFVVTLALPAASAEIATLPGVSVLGEDTTLDLVLVELTSSGASHLLRHPAVLKIECLMPLSLADARD